MMPSLRLAFALFSALCTAGANASRSPFTFFSGDKADIQDYLDWVDTTDYQGALYFASDGDKADGVAIHWNIDEEQSMLELAVAVRATGWLGFGFSENGGMKGSDMLIFEAANPTTVKDAYVTDERYPKMDDCQSWEFVNSSTDTQFLIVEAKRKLDTGDSQDWPIVNDTSREIALPRIIAAWGDSISVGHHGARNARSTIRWYGFGQDEVLDFQATMDAKAVGSFRFDQKDYNIPPDATTYESFCITADEMRAQNVPLDTGATLIGFEPLIASPYVHHYTLYASTQENNDALCDFSSGYVDLIYVWAPGEPPLKMPDGIGISIGGTSGGFNSFRLEYHYDNTEQRSDLFDSSGIQFHYQLEPPTHEAGMMQIGDPFVNLFNVSVGEGLTEHIFECPTGCSETFLADGSVTVFREALHMHQSGESMFSEHYRDGEIIRTAKAEYFDFEQQGGQNVIQEPYEVKSGDHFRTGCFYKNDDNNKDRIFGLGSSDEMCINFLMYYPRKNLQGAPFYCGVGMSEVGLPAGCDATHEQVEVAVAERALEKERLFGESVAVCPASAVAGAGSFSATGSSSSGAVSFVSSAACAIMAVVVGLFITEA